MTVREFVLAAGLLLLAAGSAPAQEKPGGTQASAARPDPARLVPYHQRFRMVMARNGRIQEIGRLDDQVVLGEDNGKPAVIRVQNIEGPTGIMTDTAVADPETLAPRRHASHSEARTLTLAFAPNRVTGTFSKNGDPASAIDQPVTGNLYDSNMLDVLLATLPLSAGYTGRLMVYLYEAGGPTPVDIAVTGAETVDGTDSWVTGVTIGGKTARYYVGKTEPRVTRIVSSPGPGMEIRLVHEY